MRKKLIYFIFSLILVLLIGSLIIAKYILPYAIINPPRVSIEDTPESLGLKSKSIQINTKDSIEIDGYWIKSEKTKAVATIILVHGIGGCKEHFLNLSKKLSEVGIESILIDSRAHGKSGGEFCTYGYKEKEDISSVVDFVKKENDTIPIGIWGSSMGGAIAIQALEYDKRIEFGIIESTFTDLRQIVYDYQKSYSLGIGLKSLCDISLNEASKIAGLKPDLVSPINSVKQIEQAVLIAHGKKDKKIKYEYGKLLFENLKSAKKELILIDEGNHLNLHEKGGKNYYKSVLKFIFKQIEV